VWLPALDVVQEWRDCSRDYIGFSDSARALMDADPSIEPRVRATDTDAAPNPDDYVRWNVDLIHSHTEESA
jgi:hypothetical protein